MSTIKNTLIIMSDEHSRKVMGAYGNKQVLTPNLDGLAARGTLFENAYCNCPICVPSRASLHTGRYPHEIGYWDNAMPYDGRVESWGHVLQKAGKPVTSIGKLHFRDSLSPTGFDEQILPLHVKDGVGDPTSLLRRNPPRRPGTKQMSAKAGQGETPYWAYDRKVTDAAVSWLEQPDRTTGWTCFVSLVLPHFPLNAPKRFRDLYDRDKLPLPKARGSYEPESRTMADMRALLDFDDHFSDEANVREAVANYYALVTALDENIGRVLDGLKAGGALDDTLVIYTSDHGDNLGARGYWGKSTMWEESVGVPMVVSGPGIPCGAVNQTPVSLIDLHATVLDAAGLSAGNDSCGESLINLTSNDDENRPVFAEYHAVGSSSGTFMVRSGHHKLIESVGDSSVLYDLKSDPEELNNLADHPAHAATLARMREQLSRFVDTEAANAMAFADQAKLVEKLGGEAVVRAITPVAYTEPSPG
jgi:choline-sulfatase